MPRALWIPCLTVAVLCYSAAQLVHSPVSNALSADAAPADIRGRYIAVFQYSFALATVVAPLLFSLLFDLSSAARWIALAALALVTVPGMLALAPRLPKSALTTGEAGRSSIWFSASPPIGFAANGPHGPVWWRYGHSWAGTVAAATGMPRPASGAPVATCASPGRP
ncbi:hypothetical protein OHT68_48185 [Streptomyces canus]|uniref:hypothetical protein n=1 Tax=Streptomyces canus TaxID=58343 RepID=UPI002E2C2170|nr:hypothetical protein [Streptomyces canus]